MAPGAVLDLALCPLPFYQPEKTRIAAWPFRDCLIRRQSQRQRSLLIENVRRIGAQDTTLYALSFIRELS